jgi:hypothetical protein
MIKRLIRFLFGKKKENNSEKDLTEMNKKEKKEFLSNDFISRMIRVEKGVSSSFGEEVKYNKTRYYNGLSDIEKKRYRKYLKNKNLKKMMILLPLVLLVGVFVFLRVDITGNVIQDNFGDNVFLIESYLMIFATAIIILSGFVFVKNRLHENKFSKNFKVLEDINLNRYLIKRNNKRNFLP